MSTIIIWLLASLIPIGAVTLLFVLNKRRHITSPPPPPPPGTTPPSGASPATGAVAPVTAGSGTTAPASGHKDHWWKWPIGAVIIALLVGYCFQSYSKMRLAGYAREKQDAEYNAKTDHRYWYAYKVYGNDEIPADGGVARLMTPDGMIKFRWNENGKKFEARGRKGEEGSWGPISGGVRRSFTITAVFDTMVEVKRATDDGGTIYLRYRVSDAVINMGELAELWRN